MSTKVATYPVSRLLRMLLSTWNRRLDLAMDISSRGDVVRLPIPGRPVYFITHPDDIHHVLVSERERFQRSQDYSVLGRYMGEGLVTMEGARWEADRKLLSPHFSKAAIAPSQALMQDEITRLADRWQRAEGQVDLFADLLGLTLTIMGRQLLGADLSADADMIRGAIDFCAKHATRRAQSLVDWARWLETADERSAIAAKDAVRAVLGRALAGGRSSVGDALVETHHAHEAIVDHLLNLFAAGYDTTGNALAFCLYELAKDAALQERVRRELAHPERGAAYLVALVQETLRFYPTVPGVGRVCRDGASWGQVEIAPGATVFVFFYGLHHRPDLWPDPERFFPERFLPEEQARLNRAAYLPFGAGPRVCIGSHFATQELMLGLKTFIPRFTFSLEGPRLVAVPGISLRPATRVRVRLGKPSAA